MCELLVWVRDKEDSGTPELELVKYRRGDVIVAMPDGHDWTPTELGHPEWVVLKVSDMTLAEGQALATPEPREPTRRLFHTRLFNLDLDHPEAAPAVKVLALKTRRGGSLRAGRFDAAQLRALRRRKPPAEDPGVIGEVKQPGVIG